MGLVISDSILKQLDLTKEELLIELAVHFYDSERFTMGQARKFANLDQISFQKELAKRNVYIKYSIEDLEDDLKTIEKFEKLREEKKLTI